MREKRKKDSTAGIYEGKPQRGFRDAWVRKLGSSDARVGKEGHRKLGAVIAGAPQTFPTPFVSTYPKSRLGKW